jgi:hypothetical protein
MRSLTFRLSVSSPSNSSDEASCPNGSGTILSLSLGVKSVELANQIFLKGKKITATTKKNTANNTVNMIDETYRIGGR